MTPTNRKFEFYKYDETVIVEKTGEHPFKKIEYFKVLGMSRNGSLVITDKFNKKRWIKKEFWESSYSPMWQETINKPKYIIREVHPNQNISEVLAFASTLLNNKN